MKTAWKRLASLFGLAMLYFAPVHGQTWDALLSTVRKRFPTVRQLSTSDLASWLTNSNRSKGLLLVDARQPEEFAVSHLQGARNLDSVAAVKSVVSSNSQPIVTYCSIGYRSAALAEKLAKAGLTNVFNLEGSIFAWANEGRPVYRQGRELTPVLVHPYDEKWGKLLKQELHPPSK